MPTAHLTDRAIIAVTGPDAEPFLQNILTTDLDALGQGETKPGALLSPQGKILFDFLISRMPDGHFRLECRADVADDFARRLTFYRLRAKAEISKQDQHVVAVGWQTESGASETDSGVADRRFGSPATVRRVYGEVPPATASESDWHAFRAAQGVPESGPDYALGDAFPHDALLDQMGGVGFRKGCYVGQEVVSRIQHRGTARRRILIARAGTAPSEPGIAPPAPGAASPAAAQGARSEPGMALPVPGTPILAATRTIGTLGTVEGGVGLALVRIDRVKDALDVGTLITAGGVPVTLAIPSWAEFDFPAETVSADEG